MNTCASTHKPTPNASGTHVFMLRLSKNVDIYACFRENFWKVKSSTQEKLSITTVICFFDKLEPKGKKGERAKHVLPKTVQQILRRRSGLIFANSNDVEE